MCIWKQTTDLATEFIDQAGIADIEEFERIDLDAFSESKFERHGIHIRRLHLPFYVHSAKSKLCNGRHGWSGVGNRSFKNIFSIANNIVIYV